MTDDKCHTNKFHPQLILKYKLTKILLTNYTSL